MGVGAADAEGGHGGPAAALGVGPDGVLPQQAYRPGVPVHGRGRPVDVQGTGQFPVAHRLDHLDDAADAGRGLGVADVGLERAEQERASRVAVLAVGGEERVGLDGIAEDGSRAVRLDGVDVGGREARVGQGPADDPLLGRSAGRGQAVAGTVLVDGAATDHGEHRVAVAACVGEAFQDDDADALGPAGAVGARGEGLAPSVGGEAVLAAELDEGAGGRHDGDAAGQGERALVPAQRLRGEVDGDERGGTGGVDREGGAAQAQGVGEASGGDTACGARAEEPLQVLREGAGILGVVVEHQSDVHAGVRLPQGGRVDAGAFDGLPADFQEQSLLRVHGEGLARADAEEGGVEVARRVEESAGRGGRGAGFRAVAAQQPLQVPAPVGGERADGVAAFGDEPPQVLR